jgi:hypothetical protein
LIVAAALFGTSALLLPTYFLVHAEADQAAEYVEASRAIAAERAKSQSQETLATFTESVKLLTAAERPPTLAHVLEVVTSDIPKGISLSDIDITFPGNEKVVVALNGTARTRAELIAYSNMLKRHPELSSVDVPVGDLVANVDSSFSMSMNWTRPAKP